MALVKRNSGYVDFVNEPFVACFNKTGAVATAADNQEDWFVCPNSGEFFEYVQIGANSAIYFLKQTGGALRIPIDNTDADAIEITQGIDTVGCREFTIGTSTAFFVRLVGTFGTVAGADVLQVGFRKQGAYVDFTTPATALAAYDDKAVIGVDTNAGVWSTYTSLNGSDTDTALAKAAITDGQYFALKVLVSATGVVTYQIGVGASAAAAKTNMAVDASAVAFTLDSADVVIPTIFVVATGGGAPNIDLVEYECGPQ